MTQQQNDYNRQGTNRPNLEHDTIIRNDDFYLTAENRTPWNLGPPNYREFQINGLMAKNIWTFDFNGYLRVTEATPLVELGIEFQDTDITDGWSNNININNVIWTLLAGYGINEPQLIATKLAIIRVLTNYYTIDGNGEIFLPQLAMSLDFPESKTNHLSDIERDVLEKIYYWITDILHTKYTSINELNDKALYWIQRYRNVFAGQPLLRHTKVLNVGDSIVDVDLSSWCSQMVSFNIWHTLKTGEHQAFLEWMAIYGMYNSALRYIIVDGDDVDTVAIVGSSTIASRHLRSNTKIISPLSPRIVYACATFLSLL